MNEYNLDINIVSPFGNLYRKKLALIAVQDLEGNILVGVKPHFYPAEIYRLVGGGVDENEEPIEGAKRELSEELGVDARLEDLIPLLQVNVHATDENGKVYENSNFIYFYKLKDNNYKAGDDTKFAIKLSVDGLYNLGEKYENLSEDAWFRNEMEQYNWKDYGKVYGPIHKLTAENLKLK
jgi:8-oxo-dGTP pyrophosphatase MutT (NUDIX family)